jgi:flagellar biosynthesis/type III secretory pathway protein FliH
MLSSHRRMLPVSLPRFELGALLLVLGLAAALAAVVGIAAFTLTESTGYSTSQLQAAAKTAYAHGHDAGYAAGLAKGKTSGQSAGYAKGRQAGLAAGKKKGRAVGLRLGKKAGYTQGYAAGQAAAQAAAQTTTKKKSSH